MSGFPRFPRSGCRNFVDAIDMDDPNLARSCYKDSHTHMEGQQPAVTTKAPPD